MVTSPKLSSLTIVAATGLEAKAIRRAAPGARVVEAGVGLAKIGKRSSGPSGPFSPDPFSRELGDAVVTCGLAGALRDDLPTGSVLVPDSVVPQDGETISCDAELANALALAARRLGYEPQRGPLLTSATLLTGAARTFWAQRGFVAADMETGLIHSQRIAAVRVILDTPQHELSTVWLRPVSALMRPQVWPQALWLWREAPRCARIAAQVLAAAFTM